MLIYIGPVQVTTITIVSAKEIILFKMITELSEMLEYTAFK